MEKQKILIADDSEMNRALLVDILEDQYDIVEADNGAAAIDLLTQCGGDFSLLLLDIMMPGMDGLEMCRKIRETNNIPIIMLSAKSTDLDKILGLGTGADDYVVKPFSPRELMMRVKVVISRNNKKDVRGGHEIFQAEGLVVDFTGRTVTVDGKRVEMSPKEYELLFYLVRNRNIALDREKLITEVWGYDYYGDDRTLDTHIKLLRSSLGEYRKFLVTLRGVGYRFEA